MLKLWEQGMKEHVSLERCSTLASFLSRDISIQIYFSSFDDMSIS